MKTSKIMVGVNGALLTLASGSKACAVYPAGKGEDKSYLLLTDGKLATLKGSRIAGVGAARYFAENGFELAKPGDTQAEQFADMLDAREGTRLVERSNNAFAQELTKKFGGQECVFVPFDAGKPNVAVKVEMPRGVATTSFDLVSGFASGQVSVEYQPGPNSIMDANLSAGWLVGPEGSPESMPRSTEYGGPVERAVFIICNSGMGELVGAKNLVMDEAAPIDALYARGEMVICLKNGDLLTVGIDAVDELGVHYTRGGEVIYSRKGLQGNGNDALKLGSIIGSIAAVLVRVNEMDAIPVKKPRASTKKVV